MIEGCPSLWLVEALKTTLLRGETSYVAKIQLARQKEDIASITNAAVSLDPVKALVDTLKIARNFSAPGPALFKSTLLDSVKKDGVFVFNFLQSCPASVDDPIGANKVQVNLGFLSKDGWHWTNDRWTVALGDKEKEFLRQSKIPDDATDIGLCVEFFADDTGPLSEARSISLNG